MLKTNSRRQTTSVVLLALLFVVGGINHFVSPVTYLKIMPPYMPWPLMLVYVSGFFEIVGGVGVLIPKLRKAAGWGLIALLIAVFPANIHMAIHFEQFPQIPFWLILARLPMQFLLIGWVYWTAYRRRA